MKENPLIVEPGVAYELIGDWPLSLEKSMPDDVVVFEAQTVPLEQPFEQELDRSTLLQ